MRLLLFVALASALGASVIAEPLQHTVQTQVTAPAYYVHVIEDGADCEYPDKTLPMCANKNFVCRMEAGQEMFATAPSCIVYDPSDMQDNPFEIEETAVGPWSVCDPAAELSRKMGDPPVCKRDFQCLCLHGAGEKCICAPPDAVSDADGATKCANGTTCSEDKYCHFLMAGGMECGQKPYYT